MKTFNDIDDFIMETFPLECRNIIKQQKSPIEESVENVDINFGKHLEGIIKGEKKESEK
jgi:hypothetical protein